MVFSLSHFLTRRWMGRTNITSGYMILTYERMNDTREASWMSLIFMSHFPSAKISKAFRANCDEERYRCCSLCPKMIQAPSLDAPDICIRPITTDFEVCVHAAKSDASEIGESRAPPPDSSDRAALRLLVPAVPAQSVHVHTARAGPKLIVGRIVIIIIK